MATKLSYTKDPDERSDWSFDWGEARLEDGETITSSTVVGAPAGLTVDPPVVVDGKVVTVFVAGGTLRRRYELTCHVVTSQGREFDWTHPITVTQASG